MNIEIIGGGSIGMLLAGRLAASALHHVKLVVRTSRQAEAISRQGITVQDGEGRNNAAAAVPCIGFEKYAAGMPDGIETPDWILLALKQRDILPPVIEAIGKRAVRGAFLCCLQNGIGHLDKLRPAVGEGRLFAAVTTVGAVKIADTEVRHTGRGIIRIGPDGKEPRRGTQAAASLADALDKAGLPALVSENIMKDIWDKLIINTAVNPLTAVLNIPNGELAARPECRRMMRRLYDEAERVAAAAGMGCQGDARWEKLLEVCRATAGNRSSMLQDLGAGRPTELEWLTGALLREAAGWGIPIPFHEALFHLVKAKEELLTGESGKIE